MSIRIGIVGYGNLGRGVENAIAQNADMELVAVFTRRSPETVKILSQNATVYHIDDIQNMIGKIVPLTRADGDPYEYFTAIIVAQSIKDVGGLTSQIALSRYDRSGTLQTENCQQGRWENGFDKVTGEAYMIVRFRRVLNCSNSASCQDGKHSSNCTFNIEVIESYTMNEP